MGNSSNNSQIISLPQGGGALSGIGEKFSPDLHTTTGNFTVPIALPPGHNGFQPELNLVYSTDNGNGPFGLGWSLIIPGVSMLQQLDIIGFDDPGKPNEEDETDAAHLAAAAKVILVSKHADHHLEKIAMKIRFGTQSKRN